MRHVKKIVSLVLTAVMVLAMSVNVFAADPEPTKDEHEYSIYQIFTGDFDKTGNVLSNVKWGQHAVSSYTNAEGEIVTVEKEGEVPGEVLDELKKLNEKPDSEKLDVIKKYVDSTSTGLTVDGSKVTKTVNDNGTVTFKGLTPGYYLVKDGAPIAQGDAATTYIVKVTGGELTITRKGDAPTVDKVIVETDEENNTTETTTNDASIGDTINFKITGTLPSNYDDYKSYTYIFTDTLSKGLTYNNDVKVEVVNDGEDAKDVTSYFYKNATTYDETNGTTLTVGSKNLKAFANLSGDAAVTIDANSKIVVTYSATLNDKAVIAGAGNKNSVQLAYTNDPNSTSGGDQNPPDPGVPTPPEGVTPPSETVTYTTELTILKNDENKKILLGAEFELSGNGVIATVVTKTEYIEDADGKYWKLKDGTYTTDEPVTGGGDDDNSEFYESTDTTYSPKVVTDTNKVDATSHKVKAEVDADGKVTFTGLGAGTYTIKETKTPAGYNTIKDIEFTISFNVDQDGNATFVSNNKDIVVGDDNMLDTTIVNKKGSNLPETGGIGTTIFYVLGAVLVLGAGVTLIARHRMNKDK